MQEVVWCAEVAEGIQELLDVALKEGITGGTLERLWALDQFPTHLPWTHLCDSEWGTSQGTILG